MATVMRTYELVRSRQCMHGHTISTLEVVSIMQCIWRCVALIVCVPSARLTVQVYERW